MLEFEGGVDDQEITKLTESGLRLINAILSRATLDDIQALVADGAPVWFQDEDEGISPLHAAAYTQRHDVAKFLVDSGAPWNIGAWHSRPPKCSDPTIILVDNFQNTAADIALSLNDEPIYSMIRDEGIRAGSNIDDDILPS